MNLEPTRPVYQNVCAYIEFLVHMTPLPKTVSNHVSHLRTYLRKAQASTIQVDNQRVKWALTAVGKDTDYIPRTKVAFPVQLLQDMVIRLPDTPTGLIIRTAVLLMYYAALRQSEVLPYSSVSYDHKKHLSRRDVTLIDGSVKVTIKHAKNLQSVYKKTSVVLQSAPDPRLCVVDAIRQCYRLSPTVHGDDPLLVFPDSRWAVPIEFVRRKWVEHLILHQIDTAPLSLHSLRKAAATAAHNEGCPEIDIQRHGGWHSNAHRSYIRASQRNVNAAVINALNK